jgi:hypothetical protein
MGFSEKCILSICFEVCLAAHLFNKDAVERETEEGCPPPDPASMINVDPVTALILSHGPY